MLDLSEVKIETIEETSTFGRFVISPLERGYGQTLGNSLRRVLLASLPGAAITTVKIAGVTHQFSTIKGVTEDVVELILNIKKIRLRLINRNSAKLALKVTGPKDVVAGDIEVPAGVEIVNPKLHIASLADKKTRLEMELTAERGEGYVMADEREIAEVGVISVDSLFTPIVRVNYDIESTRLGRRSNLDKLILEVTTDGTIAPLEAVKKAAQILTDYFRLLYEPRPKPKVSEEEKEAQKLALAKKILIEELELSTRLTNSLKRGKIKTVGDLLEKTRADLLKIRNIGEKSLGLVERKLKKRGFFLKGKQGK